LEIAAARDPLNGQIDRDHLNAIEVTIKSPYHAALDRTKWASRRVRDVKINPDMPASPDA
jgi:hypothetical protein